MASAVLRLCPLLLLLWEYKARSLTPKQTKQARLQVKSSPHCCPQLLQGVSSSRRLRLMQCLDYDCKWHTQTRTFSPLLFGCPVLPVSSPVMSGQACCAEPAFALARPSASSCRLKTHTEEMSKFMKGVCEKSILSTKLAQMESCTARLTALRSSCHGWPFTARQSKPSWIQTTPPHSPQTRYQNSAFTSCVSFGGESAPDEMFEHPVASPSPASGAVSPPPSSSTVADLM